MKRYVWIHFVFLHNNQHAKATSLGKYCWYTGSVVDWINISFVSGTDWQWKAINPQKYQTICHHNTLTNWGWDKMATILQMAFSNVFARMKIFLFRFKFHWNFFSTIHLYYFMKWYGAERVNSLCSSDAIWQQGSRSTLVQVMACCLTAPSHYLNQCWLIITKAQWCSSEGNFAWDIVAISQ